jgi:phosphoglycerate dehydrogenase-like enzyme
MFRKSLYTKPSVAMSSSSFPRSPKNKILIISEVHLEEYRRLLTNEPNLVNSAELFFCSQEESEKNIEKLAFECNIWFGSPSLVAPLLTKAKEQESYPEWVQSTWAGVEPFLKPDMPKNYILTNMRGIFGPYVAEYALGHMLSHVLQIHRHSINTSQHKWNPVPPRGLLREKSVGILGVGDIGRAVASSCRALGMTVWGYTHHSKDCDDVHHYVHSKSDIAEIMAPNVDYWVNVLPNTSETQNILDRSVFGCMKPGAVVINAGRGTAISDEDLLQALEDGTVDYAVLDVFATEPLPVEHPYWARHPKVLITSHTAAITEPAKAAPIFVQNYVRWYSLQNLKYQVDFERGY